MSDSKVSVRYASSLLDVAVEQNNLESVGSDMELVSKSLAESKELRNMLLNPVIKQELKSTIINEIYKNRIGKESLSFLNFIISKNREVLLPEIVSKFLQLRDEHLGILSVDVTTAIVFTEEQKENLRKKFEERFNKKIKFSFKIDNSIIGGFVAKIDDTVYDASLEHQLDLLKKQLFKGSPSLN